MGPKLAGCVVLADRHHGLTEGVRGLLETVARVVVMVADESSLLESAARLDAELAVAEMSLGGARGLGWLRLLRERCPATKVIVLSVHDAPGVTRALMREGAHGVVLKRAIPTELLPAVESVLAGGRYPPEAAIRG